MNRRLFVEKSSTASSCLGLGLTSENAFNLKETETQTVNSFKLNYAPHLGMFKNHAGENPVDQLNFMDDQGFTAFEDNNMKKHSLETQEAIAKTLTKRACKQVSSWHITSIGMNQILPVGILKNEQSF